MKNTKYLLFVLVTVFTSINVLYSQNSENCNQFGKVFFGYDPSCDYSPWVLVFEDDFNGNSLDFSKWDIPYQGVVRDFNHTKEKQWYANTGNSPSLPHSNNIEVSNGTLKLIARKETSPVTGTWVTDWSVNPPTTKTSTFKYTSATIDSKKSFGHGKYEIRCKIPRGKGFWPAFWMYGKGVNGRNNEIDVFEFWKNNTSDHNMNIHYNGKMCPTDYNGPDYSQNFHTFTVIWDKYKIEWYVDGQLKRRSTQYYSTLGQALDCNSLYVNQIYIRDKIYPQDNMKIIANLALENYANYHPDGSTPFPSTLEIDYIRYYKKNPCVEVVATTNSQLNLSDDLYNVIVGTSIILGGNISIESGEQLELIARDEINLNPGFTADNGSNFVARIDSSFCPGLSKMGRTTNGSDYDNQISYILVPYSNTEEDLITKNQPANRLNPDEFDVKAYPNPTNDILNIEIRSDVIGKYNIILSDMQGQILLNPKDLNSNIATIDMTSYPSGTYILQVIDIESKKSYLNQVIKE